MNTKKTIDLGWKTISLSESKWKHGFNLLIDYAPNSSNVADAIGDHFDIYETNDGGFLLKYKIIGQDGYMAPGHIAAEGFFPIPRDIAELLINRNSAPVVADNTTTPLDVFIGTFYDWIDELTPVINTIPEGKDLENDLREMITCFNASSYRGCLALAGVVLERVLRYKLKCMCIEIQDNWMVGRMLKAISDAGEYIDPSMKNIWNIINQQRIIGVHTKENVSIPSFDQAAMVLYAIKDVVSRTIYAR